jgi:hypothetical protein
MHTVASLQLTQACSSSSSSSSRQCSAAAGSYDSKHVASESKVCFPMQCNLLQSSSSHQLAAACSRSSSHHNEVE